MNILYFIFVLGELYEVTHHFNEKNVQMNEIQMHKMHVRWNFEISVFESCCSGNSLP